MRNILYFNDLFSKDTLIQSVSALPPQKCLKILSICFQSSHEGMRRYATGSIAKEFDFLSVTPVLHLSKLACFTF